MNVREMRERLQEFEAEGFGECEVRIGDVSSAYLVDKIEIKFGDGRRRKCVVEKVRDPNAPVKRYWNNHDEDEE